MFLHLHVLCAFSDTFKVLYHSGRGLGYRGRFVHSAGSDVVVSMALRGGGRGRATHKGKRRQFTAGPDDTDPDKVAAREKWAATHGEVCRTAALE